MADGCPKTGATINTINPSKFARGKVARGGVRCCSKDGQKCKSLCNRREEKVTYAEALNRCVRNGMRLCTADELASDKCCGTGCNYDVIRVWQTGGVSKSGNNNQGKNSKKYCIGL